ncbi:Hint domain-containing protein [Paracoccus sp. MBLB3053]|uniref:Hint domain-containing protein n=1 Tax=Paracoccus aurantius TaxID=3073814 RepID=A0ABU2HWK8_9RHOB|nr:Hint domain-containing protein [Paracoccus sp. MBLB3053]MDS9469416.1 Hint domain-containing protein [Paracoccus sp. MBLB3053]
MPYTGPIIFTGDHLATLTSQPTNQGNPNDANFGMNLKGVTAVGTSTDYYRLVWVQNINNSADGFSNGQFWAIQKYDPSLDTDGDPSTGEEGWPASGKGYVFTQLAPKPDLVSGLGEGENYIVFEGQGGGASHLILDIGKSFGTTPTDMYYPAAGGAGELTFSDVSSALSLAQRQPQEDTAVCYRRGTMILTERGEIAIEDLRQGDSIVCRFGGLRKIRWIGHQHFDGASAHKERAICFAPGSISEGMPRRPLFVSQGHSMLIGEILVLAANLVNGITVTRAPLQDELDYFQIDFGAHDLVLADGAWSESFADCGDFRDSFDNVAEFRASFPDHVAPSEPLLCAPRPISGPSFQSALIAMAKRALNAGTISHSGAIEGRIEGVAAPAYVTGWARDVSHPGHPIALEVVLDGKVIGTTIACLTGPEQRNANRMGFVFSGASVLSTAELRRLVVRRASDGQTITGLPGFQGRLQGHLDRVTKLDRIEGWARDEANPVQPVVLEVALGDEVLGTVLACRPRHDLAAAKLGDVAFVFELPRKLTEAEAAALQLRRVGDGAPLPRSAATIIEHHGLMANAKAA